jgi:hypothetical protein
MFLIFSFVLEKFKGKKMKHPNISQKHKSKTANKKKNLNQLLKTHSN